MLHTALILVDVQKGIFTLKNPVHKSAELLDSLKRLTAWARENGVKLIYMQHENASFLKKGSEGWGIVDSLKPFKGDAVIAKRHPGVFTETGLSQTLTDGGIKTLLICGLITNGCVRDACLQALERGYDVALVTDAHSTYYKNAAKMVSQLHDEMAQKGVRLLSTDELCSSHISSPITIIRKPE